MAKKFKVIVALKYHKEVTVYAFDEIEAGAKAEEMCVGWNNVMGVEAIEANEVEKYE